MAFETDADRTALINALGGGLTADYTHAGITTPDVGVIFEPNPVDFNMEIGQIADTAPTVMVKTSDVPDAAINDTLVISGITYTVVKDPKHDGSGMTILTLQE